MKERTLIGEAFKALEALNESEDTFNVDEEGIEEIKGFLNDDEEDDTVTVFDDEADDEEELDDSYVGKVIIDCCVCHSLIYKAPEEVIIDEETDLANVDEECPYCHSTGDGYKVVGEVAPYNPVDNDNVSVEIEKRDDIDIEDDDDDDEDEDKKEKKSKKSEKKDDEKNESLRRKNFRRLKESKSRRKSFSKLIESRTCKSALNYIPRKKNESLVNRRSMLSEGKIPHYESSVGKKLADNIAEINKQKSVDGVIKVVKSTLIGSKEPGKGTYADNFIKKLSAKKSLNDAITFIFNTILSSEGMSTGTKKRYESMMKRVIRRNLREAFDDVQISTDTEKITIKSEPRDDNFEGEMVAPIEPAIKDEILDNSAPEEEETDELNISETPEGVEEEEVTDFDEDNFNELGESFLKKHYDNVSSFKTTRIAGSEKNKNEFVVEGIVTFNSGKKKSTAFNFRGDKILPSGMHRLVGENLDICNAKKAFHVNGRIKDKKFIAESLNYNYTVGGKRVSGSVRRKKK